jgi:putative addiction module component (TIGR02574 family)
MHTIYKEIKRKAKSLPVDQRAELVHELIKSLDAKTDNNIDSEWENEIKRRVDEIKSGKAKGRRASEIHAEIQAKYS